LLFFLFFISLILTCTAFPYISGNPTFNDWFIYGKERWILALSAFSDIAIFACRRTIGYVQFLIEYAHRLLPSIIENAMRFNRIGFGDQSSLRWIRLSKCNE
jgi:hypothetical protein